MDVKVLIIEDNPLTSQDLKEIILEQGMYVTDVTKNKREALESIRNHKPDILLVDINLKDGDDGIDLVHNIPNKDQFPVIFLTANSDKETVERALKTQPASYLTKPYDDRDVIIAIELAFNNFCKKVINTASGPSASFVFLKAGNKFEKVNMVDIHYMQAEGSYTKFFTTGKEYTLSGNLNNTSEKIGHPSFIRIHRSYVVNIDNIKSMDNDYVFIGEANLPISRSYKEEVSKVLRKIS